MNAGVKRLQSVFDTRKSRRGQTSGLLNIMRFSLCVLALLLGSAIGQAAPVANAPAAPVVAEPLGEDGLKISISPTFSTRDLKDCIELLPQEPHINIVLQNTSSRPINVWAEYTSSGSHNLTLEITKIGGKVLEQPLVVSRGAMTLGNSTSTETLAPGGFLVREVRLPGSGPNPPVNAFDSRAYQLWYSNFPAPTGKNQVITMRAIFSNKSVNEEKTPEVWRGYSASDLMDYYIYRGDALFSQSQSVGF